MFFIFYYKKVIPNLSPKLSPTFSFRNVVDKSYPQIVDNLCITLGIIQKTILKPLILRQTFFVDIGDKYMCLVDNSVDNSFCFYIQTILSTLSTILYAIPPSELSPLYPQLFSTYPHVIHSLSTILSTFHPNVVDIFYRLLSSSLLKFFIIFSIISLYGLIGSFLENYHIPTSGVTND